MKSFFLKRTACFAAFSFSAASVMMIASSSVLASSLDQVEQLDQDQFLELGEQLGAVGHYKSIAPAENLGIIGFDVGIEVSATKVNDELFDLASSGSVDEAQLILGRVHVHKGLPFGIDVGASLGNAPGIDSDFIGAELRYAIVKGGVATPAIAIRATHSRLLDPESLTLTNTGLELAVSKGFLILTPYAGVGVVRTTIDAKDSNSTLQEETFDQEKLVVGATLNLGLAWTVEADRTGGLNTYSLKAGLRF